mgnify:CR=1 FL=1
MGRIVRRILVALLLAGGPALRASPRLRTMLLSPAATWLGRALLAGLFVFAGLHLDPLFGRGGMPVRFQMMVTLVMAVLVLVLVIACVNIANLALGRAAARQKQAGPMALRYARRQGASSDKKQGPGGLLRLVLRREGALLELVVLQAPDVLVRTAGLSA